MKILISIVSILLLIYSHGNLRKLPGHKYENEMLDGRALYDSDGTLLLVDSDGNQYEPYSMAWRYLGMYIDCGSNDDDNGSCYRRVLWAAYIDESYKGDSIGEYQYYNISTGVWDTSTCRSGRCAKMDCHESNTHFKLLGVFKENDGLYDFAEQLFKHQGYCIWGEDTYEFMSEYRENWPSECKSVSFYNDDGQYETIYSNVKPQAFGNFTYGLYEDDTCTTLSSDWDASSYLSSYYARNGYSDEDAEEQVTGFEYRQQRVNEYMNEYKICQPCRAYSKFENYADDDDDGSGSNDNDDHSDEGEGSEEQWGYNCYDDAGYRNCNQCYKFQTKTDMEAADTYDLVAASSQGTMLEIKVNGKMYGSGGYQSESSSTNESPDIFSLTFGILAAFTMAILLWDKRTPIINYIFQRKMQKSFKEEFITSSDASINTDDSSSNQSIELGNMHDNNSPQVDNWIILRNRIGRDGNTVSNTDDYVIKTPISKNITIPEPKVSLDKLSSKPMVNSKEENVKTKEESTYLAPIPPVEGTVRNSDDGEEHLACYRYTNESTYLAPISPVEEGTAKDSDDGEQYLNCHQSSKESTYLVPISPVEGTVRNSDDGEEHLNCHQYSKESTYLVRISPVEGTFRNSDDGEEHLACYQYANESTYLAPISPVEERTVIDSDDGEEHLNCHQYLKESTYLVPISPVERTFRNSDDGEEHLACYQYANESTYLAPISPVEEGTADNDNGEEHLNCHQYLKEFTYLVPVSPVEGTVRNSDDGEEHLACYQYDNESTYLAPISPVEEGTAKDNDDGEEHLNCHQYSKESTYLAPISPVEEGTYPVSIKEETNTESKMDYENSQKISAPMSTTVDEAIKNLQNHIDRVTSNLEAEINEISATLETKQN